MKPFAGGATALHWAASFGMPGVVAALMSRREGAWGVVVQQDDGRTPLMLASMRGHAAVACLLVAQRPSRLRVEARRRPLPPGVPVPLGRVFVPAAGGWPRGSKMGV